MLIYSWTADEALSHVVQLGNFIVKGLFEVTVRLYVALHLAQAFHALYIARHCLLLGEELVIRKPLNEVEHLEKVEVQILQLGAKQVVFLSHELQDGLDLYQGLRCQSTLISLSIAGASDGTLDLLQLTVDHIHLAGFLGCFAEELGDVGVCDVHHDCVRIRDVRLAINQIWHGGEVESERVLDACPALDRESWRVTLLIHHILVRVLRVLEEVADRLGQPTNLPVAELDWRFLRELLFAPSRRVFRLGTDCIDICLFFFLEATNGRLRSAYFFGCTATHDQRLYYV